MNLNVENRRGGETIGDIYTHTNHSHTTHTHTENEVREGWPQHQEGRRARPDVIEYTEGRKRVRECVASFICACVFSVPVSFFDVCV